MVDISFPEIEKFDNLPPPRIDGPSAFVSIMEGCSKYCSFCVVPYTRGEEVSRPFDDVIAEIVGLAAAGVREVNLLGQNVNAYRGATHDGQVVDLAAAHPLRGGHRRHRAHPLHHLASARVFRRR
jgi:tRNA-2-methylthio-N6-dimethylallyladenosine synthase